MLVVFLAETVSRTLPETRGVGRHRFFPALLAVAGWLVLLWFAPRALSGNDPTNPLLPQFRTLFENYTRETEPVAVFSTSVWPAYPTLPQLRRRQGHRFLSAPYLYIAIAARREDGGAAEKLVFGMVREDIERERPPLILVADGPCAPCEGRSFAGHVLGQLRPVMGAYTRILPPGLPPRFLVFARTAESSGG
ncbi:MAG: hypothetical protein KatS3mg076_0874 [Candidatus Binatia bacterium]|nr:MAG: hypothetical protein KatS3mg076_0874 [Candidatus Binatia bacterium]